MASAAQKLEELNITLPNAAAPAAAYVPYTVSNNVAYISGQLPFQNGELAKTGIVGKDVSLEEAQEVAKVCALNVLGHVKSACGGDLDKVKRVLKLEILVAATPEFTEPHVVANGASNLIKEVFGDRSPAISATKSLTGHSLGATGVQESIYCLLMMQNGFICKSAHIEELDPATDGADIVMERRDNVTLNTVITNSFGFGGTNATIAMQRYNG